MFNKTKAWEAGAPRRHCRLNMHSLWCHVSVRHCLRLPQYVPNDPRGCEGWEEAEGTANQLGATCYSPCGSHMGPTWDPCGSLRHWLRQRRNVPMTQGVRVERSGEGQPTGCHMSQSMSVPHGRHVGTMCHSGHGLRQRRQHLRPWRPQSWH